MMRIGLGLKHRGPNTPPEIRNTHALTEAGQILHNMAQCSPGEAPASAHGTIKAAPARIPALRPLLGVVALRSRERGMVMSHLLTEQDVGFPSLG